MPVVYFQRENVRVDAPAGASVLEAARMAGVFIESPCGGAGTCGKCAVLLRGADGGDRRALACKTRVGNGMAVETVAREQNGTMKIVRTGERVRTQLRPAVEKRYDAETDRTAMLFDGETAGYGPGDTSAHLYGASVDIGTTTLVVSLLDLRNGETVAEASALNPQSVYAQDVLSRISLAAEADGLQKLFEAVRDAVNALLAEAAAQAGADMGQIYELIYSGNTCMLHLAANVSPASLGAYPYTPALTGGSALTASAAGLRVSPLARVWMPPVLSAYVGADITSGILATSLHKKKGTTLFVDIGTNGEMVVAKDGRLFAASTAAGPAFEGMNIACGMRAAAGAVEFFEIGPTKISVRTIGGAPSAGICGSGLLDIAGELAAHGVIEPNGRFTQDADALPSLLARRLVRREGEPVFVVQGGVYLSQKDIRQIQLAKGAIRAGIELLLGQVDVQPEEVDEVLIAGSFGYHLRAKSLLAIGLLPSAFEGKIRFVGNTSKAGGEALLLDADLRAELLETARGAQVVELAGRGDFQTRFMDCLNF